MPAKPKAEQEQNDDQAPQDKDNLAASLPKYMMQNLSRERAMRKNSRVVYKSSIEDNPPLTYDINTFKPDDKPICPICFSSFSNRDNWRRHLINTHRYNIPPRFGRRSMPRKPKTKEEERLFKRKYRAKKKS